MLWSPENTCGSCCIFLLCYYYTLLPSYNRKCYPYVFWNVILSIYISYLFIFHFYLFAGPPSPPRNLMFNLNDTCLMLEWSPPSDMGGRRDLTYNVQCKRCGPEPDQCQLCEDELRFLPGPLGLTNATVTVMDFSAHANYTFEIESLNGVSDMSSFPRQVAIITVSTDQGGEYYFCSACYLSFFLF